MTADILGCAVEAIADGRAPNWRVLEEVVRSNADRECLRCLEIVDKISSLHRSTAEEMDVSAEAPTFYQPNASADSSASAEGTWGRYRLVEKVGAGSFGAVYRAWDSDLEREVAIKILHPILGDDEKARLLKEGRALAKVRHPNVVNIFGMESHGDRVGLCMEFVKGETLAAVLGAHGVFSAREAVLVGEDLCRALAEVHRIGFIHRDVKTRNVMRDETGRIVLMDFGTGLPLDSSAQEAPMDVAGTPLYMAPEILEGEPASRQSDVYSVGVLLYHLVTGGYPVTGTDLDDLRRAHRENRRSLLSEHRSDLPLAFIQVMAAALAIRPEQRFGGAAAFLEALGTLSETTRPASSARITTREPVSISPIALGELRARMLAACSLNELRRLKYEVEQYLSTRAHDVEGRLLRDDIKRALLSHAQISVVAGSFAPDGSIRPSHEGVAGRVRGARYLTVTALAVVVAASVAIWRRNWPGVQEPAPVAVAVSHAPLEPPRTLPEGAERFPAPSTAPLEMPPGRSYPMMLARSADSRISDISRVPGESEVYYFARVRRILTALADGKAKLGKNDFVGAITSFRAVERDQAGYQGLDALIAEAERRRHKAVQDNLRDGQANERAGRLREARLFYLEALNYDPSSAEARDRAAAMKQLATQDAEEIMMLASAAETINDQPFAMRLYQQIVDLMLEGDEVRQKAVARLEALKR